MEVKHQEFIHDFDSNCVIFHFLTKEMLHGYHSLFEESRCKSWSRISCLESKTLTACTFPQDLLLCDTSLESPSVKLKSRRHPCHALPLPPGSPPSEKLQSKWRKGRLLGRGTFGHVYEGFNR